MVVPQSISVYDFEETNIADLKLRIFKYPTEEQAKFVLNNRNKNYKDIESSAYIYDLLKIEIMHGKLIQKEL